MSVLKILHFLFSTKWQVTLHNHSFSGYRWNLLLNKYSKTQDGYFKTSIDDSSHKHRKRHQCSKIWYKDIKFQLVCIDFWVSQRTRKAVSRKIIFFFLIMKYMSVTVSKKLHLAFAAKDFTKQSVAGIRISLQWKNICI